MPKEKKKKSKPAKESKQGNKADRSYPEQGSKTSVKQSK